VFSAIHFGPTTSSIFLLTSVEIQVVDLDLYEVLSVAAHTHQYLHVWSALWPAWGQKGTLSITILLIYH
jgi:hypothetical protein